MTSDADSRSIRIGYIFAILGVLAFSTRPVTIRFGFAHGADAETLLALRMGLSLPFFIAMTAIGVKRAKSLRLRDVAAAAGLGLVGYWIASYLDFLGLRTVEAGPGRLILFLYPTFVLALSAAFLGKRPTPAEIVGLAVAYVGLALVLAGESEVHAIDAGAFLILAAAFAYAVFLVGGSAVIRRIGSFAFTGIAMSAASFVCIAQFFLLRPPSLLLQPPEVMWAATWIALGATVMPVLAISESLKRIGANRSAIVGALGPVSTVLLAWIGLDEAMGPVKIVGAVLVVGGVIGVTIAPTLGAAVAKPAAPVRQG